MCADMTMRDAHQLLLATRARTVDLEKNASIAFKLLYKALPFECWGRTTLRTDSCTRTPGNVSVPFAPLRQACVLRCWSEAPMRLATLPILTMLLKNFLHIGSKSRNGHFQIIYLLQRCEPNESLHRCRAGNWKGCCDVCLLHFGHYNF